MVPDRHQNVRYDQIGTVLPEQLQALGAVLSDKNLPEASLQQLTDLFARKIFILDMEDRNVKLPLYAHDAPFVPDAAAQW